MNKINRHGKDIPPGEHSYGHAILGNPDFRKYLLARFLSSLGMMMLGVAVGWQVYDLTHNPYALGFVGLVQFLPAFLLMLPGGAAADRFDRRYLLLFALLLQLVTAIALFLITRTNVIFMHAIFAVLALVGIARAFSAPASQSLLPRLVPAADLPTAVAWSSISFQAATITGPALGGFLYVSGPVTVYATSSVLIFISIILVLSMKTTLHLKVSTGKGLQNILAGVHYVWGHKEILGAVSLDLFAVLFGGATALLPVYARDILHIGPWGLGILRSSPAVGATLTAAWLAYHPLKHAAGRKLLFFVSIFGICTIIFGLSHFFVLSIIALVALGASDMVSVVIRQSIIQIRTPDAMRGRVSAVNMLFIGASNELGEFESGMTAGLFGAVPAVVLGGIGTLFIVGLWTRLFPGLYKIDRFEEEL